MLIHLRQLAFALIFMAATSILAFAINSVQTPQLHPLGFVTGRSGFGSTGIGSTGWLMPADVPITTSYEANRSLSEFVGATLNVFPFQIIPGTNLSLSIYLAGSLTAFRQYKLTGSYTTPADMIGAQAEDVANFTDSKLGFTVAALALNVSFPAGTEVTVVAWASNRIWVQIDEAPTSLSFEAPASTSYDPSATIALNTGSLCPHTLSWMVDSNV